MVLHELEGRQVSAYVTWDISTYDADGVHLLTYGVRAVLRPTLDDALMIARADDSRVSAVEVNPRSSKLKKMPGVEGVVPLAFQTRRRVSARVTLGA